MVMVLIGLGSVQSQSFSSLETGPSNYTSTTTHLLATSNISTHLGPNELKLCTCAVVHILITISYYNGGIFFGVKLEGN